VLLLVVWAVASYFAFRSGVTAGNAFRVALLDDWKAFGGPPAAWPDRRKLGALR
jgi:hypothetical protein